jgi:hypothetical protein
MQSYAGSLKNEPGPLLKLSTGVSLEMIPDPGVVSLLLVLLLQRRIHRSIHRIAAAPGCRAVSTML